MVILADGRTKPLEELQVGNKVLAADRQGNLVPSDFLMFMDQDRQITREFHVLETDEPRRRLTLTPTHLVFVMNNNSTNSSDIKALFASNVKLGQWLLAVGDDRQFGVDHRYKAPAVEGVYPVYQRVHGKLIRQWHTMCFKC
ncbi:Tiggy-winkle hedgehog protein [Collichthys lucidus]|uniref:Tiggy-winkle hedgehog protein n=1 Tax=Collichthys lucidus TaxID=240159 RepID=A0A4U5V2H3_COLLU|nr:Tiggy-winkle hedgehog protein [Collichthys lucidus]